MKHSRSSHAWSKRLAAAVLLAASTTSPLTAQHAGSTAPSVPTAPREGAQFDFLVGQWDVVARPKATTLAQKIHGVPKLVGVWKGWRALDGWGIEDELRLTDASGNPLLLSHVVRYFDNGAHKWSLSSIDVYKGVVSTAAAEWRAETMIVSGNGTEVDGRKYLSRGTFSKVTQQGFSYRLDRSFDGGATWTEGVTQIEAKRIAAIAPR